MCAYDTIGTRARVACWTLNTRVRGKVRISTRLAHQYSLEKRKIKHVNGAKSRKKRVQWAGDIRERKVKQKK
ncbi:hypothetical protein AAMO2058_000889200 [Amorphochlora amoebiformis]